MGGVVESDPSSNSIYLAGVSVQNTRNLTDVVQSDIMSKPPKCYVAYGDYTGTAQDAEKDGSVVGGAVKPYVVTSPRGVEIPVRNEKGVQEKLYLYGDGADAGIVKRIYEERNGSDGSPMRERIPCTSWAACPFKSSSSLKYASIAPALAKSSCLAIAARPAPIAV